MADRIRMFWILLLENRSQNTILLITRIFPRPCGARKNTTQLAKYPHVLHAKPSNKVYILPLLFFSFVYFFIALP